VGEKCEIKLRPGRELDLAPGDAAAARASVRKLHDHLAEYGASLTISGPDGKSVTLNGQDALYQQAVEVVRSSGQASTSQLQRVLKIGYNRAARLMEDMEKDGVVSAMGAAGHRKVLEGVQ
jgi:DNA segregation ATPase FtsK/SpoIIIE-like protein